MPIAKGRLCLGLKNHSKKFTSQLKSRHTLTLMHNLNTHKTALREGNVSKCRFLPKSTARIRLPSSTITLLVITGLYMASFKRYCRASAKYSTTSLFHTNFWVFPLIGLDWRCWISELRRADYSCNYFRTNQTHHMDNASTLQTAGQTDDFQQQYCALRSLLCIAL